MAGRLKHRHTQLISKVTQLFQGGAADAAGRRIDHSQQSVVVVLVYQQTQVSHDVFHFGTAKERHPAADFVRNTVAHQQLFKQAALVVTAIQNRVILELGAIGKLMGQQFGYYPLGFVLFVFGH